MQTWDVKMNTARWSPREPRDTMEQWLVLHGPEMRSSIQSDHAGGASGNWIVMTLRVMGFVTYGALCDVWCSCDNTAKVSDVQRLCRACQWLLGQHAENFPPGTPLIFAARHQKFTETGLLRDIEGFLATKFSGCPHTSVPWGLTSFIWINGANLKADDLPAKHQSTGRCSQVWIMLLPGLPGTPGGPGLPLGPSRGGPGIPGGPGGPCRPGNPWKPGSPFRPGSPGGPGGPGNPSSPFCPVKSHLCQYCYKLI